MSVVIYCRLSFDREGSGLGVARQEQECREFASAHGWNVTQVFVDNDISATTGKRRPGFEALLTAKPEAVVVWHIDRIVRVSKDLERVLELGCNVYALQAGHLDLSTPAGRAVARTVTAWATYEGEIRTARQLAANRQRAARGDSPWVNRPFGYELDKTVREDEAALIRKGYLDILNGATYTEVARQWNTSPHGGNRVWRYSQVRQVLSNPRNAGLVAYRGEIVGKGNWEALASEDMWRAVLPKVRNSGRRSGVAGAVTALCSGLVICEKCLEMFPDAPLHEVTFRLGRSSAEYNCRKFHTSIPVKWLDDLVWWRALEEFPRFKAAWTGPGGANDEEVTRLRSELEALGARMAELGEAFAKGAVPLAVLTAATDEAKVQRDQLEAKLDEALRQNFEPVNMITSAVGTLLPYITMAAWDGQGMSLGQRRQYISAVFEKISVSPRACLSVHVEKPTQGQGRTERRWRGWGSSRPGSSTGTAGGSSRQSRTVLLARWWW